MAEYDREVFNCFADRLKELRGAETQEAFGRRLGVSRGAISYYENRDRVPDICFLARVAEEFRVSMSYLLGESDNKRIENDVIGSRLGLSDAAIEFLEWHDDVGWWLSEMIEHSSFDMFCKCVASFLYEESWRRLIADADPREYAATFEAEDVEEFRIFQLFQMFVSMIRSARDQYVAWGDEERNKAQKGTRYGAGQKHRDKISTAGAAFLKEVGINDAK